MSEKVDLAITEDFDLIIENGDFATVTKQELIRQKARIKIRVNDPEWMDLVSDHIGANLEDLRGLPNTPETAEMGVQLIQNALTRDGDIASDDIYIKPTPLDRNVLTFFVFIKTEYSAEPIGFEVRFNLTTGITIGGV